jgi:hypothetical protein
VEYNSKRTPYATCRYVTTLGPGTVVPELNELIQYHDHETKVASGVQFGVNANGRYPVGSDPLPEAGSRLRNQKKGQTELDVSPHFSRVGAMVSAAHVSSATRLFTWTIVGVSPALTPGHPSRHSSRQRGSPGCAPQLGGPFATLVPTPSGMNASYRPSYFLSAAKNATDISGYRSLLSTARRPASVVFYGPFSG